MDEQVEQRNLDELELVQKISNRILAVEAKVAELDAGQKEIHALIRKIVKTVEMIAEKTLK